MSIFKAKKWWSDEILKSGETSEGVQNGFSMKVDKFSSHSESDCIIVAEDALLKIYKPTKEENASDTLLEIQLKDCILQVETGKFVAGIEDRQILVLHPQSYAVYQLIRKEGHTDDGDQNVLKQVIKHSFSRRAYSAICGPFKNIKTRDFICIQALDGSLSFFDQETFVFIYVFNDVIIPGPVAYVESSDVFVICKSTWVLEIYSYQQLKEFGELTARQNKRNIPQWVYNAGEEISLLQVIRMAPLSKMDENHRFVKEKVINSINTNSRDEHYYPTFLTLTSSNFSSIFALGEKYLCCFQDNGLMKYMLRFEYMAICFCAYIIGWYYEPSARLLAMVASEDSKLHIYENTTLLWSCDLLQPPISISRCFLKYLSGGVVTLSAKGIVTISYLGTQPDLNANVEPTVNDTADPEQIGKELGVVEENLRKILDGDEDDSQYAKVEQLVRIKANAGKPVQNLFEQFREESDQSLHLLMCPVVVLLTCLEPSFVHNVQITYSVTTPFVCSESTICLDNVNGTEIIESQVFLSNNTDISDATVKILFTVTDSNGKICILTREVLLPLSLYCIPMELVTDNEVKVIIETNHPCIEVADIFTDYTSEELLKHGNAKEISFAYRSTKRSVTLKATEQQYLIEANDIADITSLLHYVLFKLADHYDRMDVEDFSFSFNLEEQFTNAVTHRFLKCVEAHAKERIKLKSYEDELSVLHRQFTLVQKKLLVQYGSLPPGDTEPLEFLMKDTHERVIKAAQDIIESRENTNRAGNTLAAVGQLLVVILKRAVEDQFTVGLIQEMFALNSLYEDHQHWEESVIQGLSYVLNKVLQKSEKDKEKLAPVTEQGILSYINLKKFIKQIRLVLDTMFLEAKWKADGNGTDNKDRVTRIEEFVEIGRSMKPDLTFFQKKGAKPLEWISLF